MERKKYKTFSGLTNVPEAVGLACKIINSILVITLASRLSGDERLITWSGDPRAILVSSDLLTSEVIPTAITLEVTF